MNVLVTGGTGNTGERVVRRLIADGHRVRFLSRKNADNEIVSALIKDGAEHVQGACGDPAFQRAAEGCDALVAVAHIRHADQCIGACRAAGIRRYIQISSTRRFTKFPCESSRLVIAGEDAIVRSDLDYTILRPTMIHGGRNDGNVSRVQQWFRKRSWFPIIGDGSNLVQPIHSDDVVQAIILSLNNSETIRNSYNIAGAHPITQREFLERIAASAGRRPRLLRVPQRLALIVAALLPREPRERVRRSTEDKAFPNDETFLKMGFSPRAFLQPTPSGS